ncbi:MAG: hypothetical protein JJU29_07620, partial [Verrucomicrobia bacterium]|nr:hypothetical protein [Verrucomicrobiota bacterium]
HGPKAAALVVPPDATALQRRFASQITPHSSLVIQNSSLPNHSELRTKKNTPFSRGVLQAGMGPD